jgi:phosphoribosylformylglycinamidine synthase
MAGGRVGKDGIHGATFSSLELNEASPCSAVQIGDPLTQKRLLDFVIEARDAGLYSGITDNGAGGLSSSVGEMSQFTGGATIDAALVPLKYQGLDPWEIVVSESQERMTLAVPKEKWNALADLARVHGVEVTSIGTFDGSGAFRIRWNGKPVASLPIHFLHKELKPMRLEAVWQGPQPKPNWVERKPAHGSAKVPSGEAPDMVEALKTVLGRPNVRSKESLVRRFDHEVQAATVGKPFTGVAADGPADGGVIWLRPHGASDPWSGVAVASGINPKIAHVDTWLSAQFSLDEAVRNAVASGADPDMMCLVDNFCWPDPLPGSSNPDAAHKLGQLVRSARALAETSIAWGMPFVSGKDSMKNDFSGTTKAGQRVKISVPPTVLVTAVGKVPDVRRLAGSDFKSPNSLIYLVGADHGWPMEGTEYAGAFPVLRDCAVWPRMDLPLQIAIYRKVHRAMMGGLLLSCHDVSDGGLASAICESAIGGRIGCRVEGPRDHSWWFHEGPGRFVVSVDAGEVAAFERIMDGVPFRKIGQTHENSPEVILTGDGREIFNVPVMDIAKWWRC